MAEKDSLQFARPLTSVDNPKEPPITNTTELLPSVSYTHLDVYKRQRMDDVAKKRGAVSQELR